MIPGLDSATPPTTAQAQAARAAGVRLWAGYLATRANVNLLNPWTPAQFEVARLCGATPIAYCSGLDDPLSCRTMAAALDVRLCLDVEAGIRGDGSWVQPWLTAAGTDRTGLYGNAPVHAGRVAAFHILAAYPASGDPSGATWNASPRPAGPCGWQWAGSHQEFGVEVDRGDYDDYFLGGSSAMTVNDCNAVLLGAIHGTGQALLFTQAQVDALSAEYIAGTKTLDRLVADIVNTPAAVAYKKAVAALIAGGGTSSGAALVPHTHPVSTTTGAAVKQP